MTASPERALIERLFCVISEMGAPNKTCRALRSAYSHRGVCTVLPAGTHHGLCDEWNQAVCDARDYLLANPSERTRQLELIEVTAT